ncbi:isoleucine--tRNA ligase [Dinghuibacter silviterrae]|uniref:Isoleucine--tRNA ligase n=1 Tax=Dinghuibacter silviterrae TaxID=1539049 RepID=A0A4R8DPT0_9BACT|nr:isoleucine--tRNA ligase [Dinghuibacter silviterrae]TDW99414.1 isoleucyl-tRNA synthetase [Dinghuibacter silviterrae]
MSAKYREYQQLNLPSIEKEVLDKWAAERTFQQSVDLREGAGAFVFYEGPPSANGMPGIHHVISRTLKDLVCRFQTMKGHQVKRKAGWDTHGLPVELGVEKMLGITKDDIGKKISIAEYNAVCRREVLKYKDKWDELTTKMGYWVDLDHPYITFENNYIESLWWILKELYKKGLLYESVSIQPYSPAAGTGLSSHELNQPGTYKDVKDTSCVAMFKAAPGEAARALWGDKEVFFMAWTTTPWTLPSNLGLTVGAKIDYALVKTFNPYTHQPVNVVLAKALIGKYFKPEGENADFSAYLPESKLLPWSIIGEFKGSQLENLRYEQLLPYPANTPEKSGATYGPPLSGPFRVLLGDFVTTEDGTGIVHTAPAFGADDYRVGKKYGIGILTLVDKEGKFVDGLGEFSHRYVKNYKDDPQYADVNVDICVKLKKENRAFKIEKYEHSYPHCWRTDKPILYYPLDAWFIKTTALKDRMVELNKTIQWKPKSTGEGRFGNWLENMVDWNLSRDRFWGTPLPVWRTEDWDAEVGTGEEVCIGSVAELKAAYQLAVEAGYNGDRKDLGDVDLHKPTVDELILLSPKGKPMKRVHDLVDVWFDSGAMPYAQWHFPFENKDVFTRNYPADFIAEGVDQTRGWFYTLHAIAALIKESVEEELGTKVQGLAYKAVVSNGLVLDKDGNKMSKRVGNVVDPFDTIHRFGADATRWYLITNASPWESLKFDVEGIREVQRKFFGTLYNTYQFFALYANVDGFAFKEAYIPPSERPEIDRWIISALQTLVGTVDRYMKEFEPTQAGRAIEDFVDEQLSNWYVRLCRRRFWKGEYEHDKICAYQTLYECLETVILLMAPIAPFFSEALFGNLNSVTNRISKDSIHHADFPVPQPIYQDTSLEERMQLAQDISSLVLSLRKKVNIKVRQPLQRILIPILDPGMRSQVEKVGDLIRSEVNVKEIQFLTDTEGFIKKKIKPNFKALGNRLGAKMKPAAAAIGALGQDDIARLEKERKIPLILENETLEIGLEDVDISSEDIPGWTVASKGSLTVALDVTVTPELAYEGNARELVNRIQKIRKDSGFELTDRVEVKVAASEALASSVAHFSQYICTEILADSLEIVPDIQDGIEIEVNDISLKVIVTKKGA